MEIYAVSEEQAGRFRTAAHFAALEGFKSFSEWAVHLIEQDTQRLEREHRGGQPFPPTQPVRGASQRKS